MADLTGSALAGFQSGQQMAGTNPMGDFIKNMLAVHQQNQQMTMQAGLQMGMSRADTQNKLNAQIIQNAKGQVVTGADLTGKPYSYTVGSAYTPQEVSGAYRGLGMQQPTPSANPIPGSSSGTSMGSVGGGTGMPAGQSVVIGPKGTKVNTSSGMGMALVQFSKDQAQGILDNLKKGDVSGYVNADARTKSAVANLASEQKVELDPLVLGYNAKKTALGNVRIMEQKISTGNLARTLIDTSYDPKTGNYNVAPSNHQELAIAVARLLSPSGQIAENMVNELKASTGREAMSRVGIYFGMDPKALGGPTQSVVNLFATTIRRETQKAQQMRDQYLQGNVADFGQGETPMTQNPIPGMNQGSETPEDRYNRYKQIVGAK